MDINDVRGLGTIFALFSFLCVVAWAYSTRHKDRFEDDGMIPFVETEDDDATAQKESNEDVKQKNTNDDKGSE
ncbi:MAG: cytochrome c oxidase cbb3-type subunit 4 [Oleispira sp.]|jgi:cytochrome c oxidase cbb3-type subunit 4